MSDWLHTIPWTDAAVIAAVIAGVFCLVRNFTRRDPPSARSASANASSKIEVENKPKNVFKPSVIYGLDERGVGEEVGKAVKPVMQTVGALSEQVKAMRAELAKALPAPKQPVPDS